MYIVYFTESINLLHIFLDKQKCYGGWGVGVYRAMVLGSFQCRGVLLLWHIVGKGPAVVAAGVGRVFFFFLSRLSYLPFQMPHLLGDGWT